jgi:hypothetical protein
VARERSIHSQEGRNWEEEWVQPLSFIIRNGRNIYEGSRHER